MVLSPRATKLTGRLQKAHGETSEDIDTVVAFFYTRSRMRYKMTPLPNIGAKKLKCVSFQKAMWKGLGTLR